MESLSRYAQNMNRSGTVLKTRGDPAQAITEAFDGLDFSGSAALNDHGRNRDDWSGCVGKTTCEPALLTCGVVQEMCSHRQAMEASHWGKGEQSRIRAMAGI